MGAALIAAGMAMPVSHAHGVEEHPEPICDEFITGGGFITGPSGERVSFSVKAGSADGVAYGRFNAQSNGVHSQGKVADVYLVIDPTTRMVRFVVQGSATVDEARLVLQDVAEAGRADTLDLQLLKDGNVVYQASGPLAGGGNIQLHKCK